MRSGDTVIAQKEQARPTGGTRDEDCVNPTCGARMCDSLDPIMCPHCQRALSEKEIRSILGQFARSKRLSSLGASRFAKMTAEERSAEGRSAATARWAKREARES